VASTRASEYRPSGSPLCHSERRHSFRCRLPEDVAMDPDILMIDSDADDRPETRHFVIAVDFGTTFSSVAYVGYTHPSLRRRIGFQQLEIVDRYPDHPYGSLTCHDVPTELWYSQRIARPLRREKDALEHQPLGDDDDDTDDTDDTDDETSSEDTPPPNQQSFARVNGDSNATSLRWGYGVQDQLKEADHDGDLSRHLARFKLLLDDSAHTANVRSTLGETCKALTKMGFIKQDTDIIADYLEQLFHHTKKRLIGSEGYTDASTVEFVLCVPAIWKAKACRQMQVAMATAITNSGLGQLQNGSVDNLFLVSEPEAAAACLLASEKTRLQVRLDSTGRFILLTCLGWGHLYPPGRRRWHGRHNHLYGRSGDPIAVKDRRGDAGGWVKPCRLPNAADPIPGALCGSSFINERFEHLLIERLKDEEYLWQNGEKLSKIINGLVVEFERGDKKRIDGMFPDRVTGCDVRIPRLKENKKKRFSDGRMNLSR